MAHVNPWLTIPEADYVGHMSAPNVGQRQALSRIFHAVLRDTRPGDVMVAGCSTGNGFEHFDPFLTRHVTGVDLNQLYLQRLAERFQLPGVELETRCTDLAICEFGAKTFDLVHAALVFEYLPWQAALPTLARALKPRGTLSVVLQRPSSSSPAVTPTPFTSLLALESIFQFVEPDAVVEAGREARLCVSFRATESLPSGKSFEVLRMAAS